MTEVAKDIGRLHVDIGTLGGIELILLRLTDGTLPEGEHGGAVNLQVGTEVVDGALEILQLAVGHSPQEEAADGWGYGTCALNGDSQCINISEERS